MPQGPGTGKFRGDERSRDYTTGPDAHIQNRGKDYVQEGLRKAKKFRDDFARRGMQSGQGSGSLPPPPGAERNNSTMSVPPPQGMTLPPEAPPISPGPGGNPPMVPPPMKPIASVGFRPMPGGGGGPMPMPRTPMSGFPQPGQQGGMPGSGVVPGGGMNSPLMQYYMSLMNRNPMMGRGRY